MSWDLCYRKFPKYSDTQKRTSYTLADFMPTIDLDEIYVQYI